MQSVVDMLAKGVTCVTLVIVGRWVSYLLIALNSFTTRCTIPPLSHFMPLESPSIFSYLTALAQSSGTQGQLQFSLVLTLYPLSLPSYIRLHPMTPCPPITSSTDRGCNMAHRKL